VGANLILQANFVGWLWLKVHFLRQGTLRLQTPWLRWHLLRWWHHLQPRT